MPGRFGLLIGNSKYRSEGLRQLMAPLSDVEGLASVLRRPEIGGFEVHTLLSAPRSDIEPAVQKFFEERDRDDLLLLYFSGHGLKNDRGDLFLAASDTERKYLEATAVSARFVHDRMENCRAQCQVIVLDCCFSGAFPRGVTVKAGDQVQSGEYFNVAGSGQVVLTACDDMQYAFEGDELKERAVARSAFTKVLVEGLETGSADLDRDGLVRLNELHEYVVQEFKERKWPQRPRKWVFDAFEDIVLARNPNLADLLPSEVRDLINSERASDRIAATVRLGRLLASRNERQAKAAREALQYLAKGDSRRVAEAAKAQEAGQGALLETPPAEPSDDILVRDQPPPTRSVDEASPKIGGQIFISYRRDDSSGWAGRLYDGLDSHFSSSQTFMDVVNLDLGVDFVEVIEKSVGSCDVLIAVIGKRWLVFSDQEGRRRLDNPEDFVRIEIATALKRNIRVIPVLVDGALMPRASDLPDDLRLLTRRQGLSVSNERFRADLGRLIDSVEGVLKASAEKREREERERLEAERRQKLEQERLETERRLKLDQERLEAERRQKLEQERLETERRQKLEQERLEAERNQKLEQDRLEAERRQKLEQERLETERRQKLEQQRLEAERFQKMEKERLETERRQKLEQQRLEAERLQKLEKERLETERRQKLEQQRLEAERLQKLEKERLETERRQKLELKRLKAERRLKEAQERRRRNEESPKRLVPLALAVGLIALVGIGYAIYQILSPPPPPVFGDVVVETDPPGAAITLDGSLSLKAPNTFKHVQFGNHRLIANLDKYEPITQEFWLREGVTPKIGLRLQPVASKLAALTVQTEPAGASILLDGEPPQKPPNTFTHVPFGSHRLTASLKGYLSAQQDLEINEATSAKIGLKLQPVANELAALTVQTEPTVASILLDGEPPQKPPSTFTHIPFGSHRLTASLKGYLPAQQELQVNEATWPKIVLKLQPIPTELAALSIQTEPPNAFLLLDGKPPQVPSNIFTHVSYGSHRLTANLKGYVPAQQDLQVNEATSPKIALKLQPIPTELAALSIQTEPPNASLLLDGKPPQEPPNTFTHVSFGGHRLTANLKGYVPAQQDLQVDEATSPKIVLKADADAMNNLGLQYEHGIGVAQDYSQAREWYQKAAEAGNTNAMYNLGSLYKNGPSVVQNYALAREWFQKSAAVGDTNAMTHFGRLYENGQGGAQDYARAREWYQKAADADNAYAMYNLGRLYENGQGVEEDYAKAREWYQKAAAGGIVDAMIQLGLLYQNGAGVVQDYAKSREWYQKAAALGNAYAMNNLGWLYMKGFGVEQDYAKALEWYRKAAEAGNPQAMYNLGWLYQHGLGVAEDDGTAREWYQKGADAGDTDAKRVLRSGIDPGRRTPHRVGAGL